MRSHLLLSASVDVWYGTRYDLSLTRHRYWQPLELTDRPITFKYRTDWALNHQTQTNKTVNNFSVTVVQGTFFKPLPVSVLIFVWSPWPSTTLYSVLLYCYKYSSSTTLYSVLLYCYEYSSSTTLYFSLVWMTVNCWMFSSNLIITNHHKWIQQITNHINK